MVGSASGPGSTFKAFLGSARVRVPLSNKIRVRVGSVQHIYRSLRVRVRILGPVKTSSVNVSIFPMSLNSVDFDYIYIYAFSRRFYPKRLTVHSGYTFVLSVCVFPGNRTHNLCAANAANAML